MDAEHVRKVEQNVSRLAALVEGFRRVHQLTITVLGVTMGVVGILVTIAIFAFNNLSGRIDSLSGRVDAIPRQLTSFGLCGQRPRRGLPPSPSL
jgi:hypothetical protein